MALVLNSSNGTESTASPRPTPAGRVIECAPLMLSVLLATMPISAVSQEKPVAPHKTSDAPAPLIVAPSAAANTMIPAPTASGSKESGSTKLAAEAPPAEKLKVIALILPLSSKVLGKAAEAAKAGFLTAAELSGKTQFEARVYLAEDEANSMALLYRKAVTEGTVAVVAGLTRDGATIVARESGFLPTLALNTPADLSRADANNFFYITLSLDWDARLAARAAAADGFRNVAIVVSNASLAKRTQEAFEKEWLKLGGTVATRILFSGDLDDAPKVRTAMEKSDAAKADVVFLAADMSVARFARPYLPQGLPVFATAQTFDPRAGAVENLDLDSVKYPEIPWFAERDRAAVIAYARPQDGMPTEYERLYALGIDAWRIVYALVDTAANAQTNKAAGVTVVSTVPVRSNAKQPFMPIDGVTGRITLEGNQFLRALPLVEMRDGRPQVVKLAD